MYIQYIDRQTPKERSLHKEWPGVGGRFRIYIYIYSTVRRIQYVRTLCIERLLYPEKKKERSTAL